MARILVVNDDPHIHGMLEAVLALAEHDVTMAHTGEDAMRRLRARPFDLMLLDATTSGVCGYELLELARELPDRGRMPVIAIIGTERPASGVPGTATVTKPLQIETLLGTIERALSSNQARPNRDEFHGMTHSSHGAREKHLGR
ncbi:MAG TPA: response regulator [Actinomycetota bacterium]